MKELFSHASPIFHVNDVPKTAKFYQDVLGFTIDFQWEDPPSYIVMHRGSVGIHLTQSNVPMTNMIMPSLYIFVHDADEVYSELKQKGVKIMEPISDTDYAMREFMIEDLNGMKIMIGKGS